MSDTIETPETQTAPEVAGDVAQDANVVGAMTPQEMGQLQGLRSRSTQITMEIGNIEIRKARLLGSLSELEDHANRVMQEVGQRLGIPDGTQYQILPDGRVRTVPSAS